MKKLLFLMLLMVIPALCFGGAALIGEECLVSGGACDTLKDSETTAYGAAEAIGSASVNKYFGSKWTVGSSYTCCALRVYIRKHGSPTSTLTAYIYSNNATPNPDEPNASIGTSTNTLTASDVTTSWTEFVFTFSGVSLTNANINWQVLVANTVNADNYYEWYCCTTDTAGAARGSDGSSWASRNKTCWFKTYSE